MERGGRGGRVSQHEIQPGPTFVTYFIISLLHPSVRHAGSFIFHMTGFLIMWALSAGLAVT